MRTVSITCDGCGASISGQHAVIAEMMGNSKTTLRDYCKNCATKISLPTQAQTTPPATPSA